MPPSASILDATRVTACAERPGRYRACVAPAWNAPIFPNGGLTSALALRAMQVELDRPHQPLRSFATMFVAKVEAGDIQVDVERLRIGRRMSQLRADVHGAGRDGPGHVVTAAFGEEREGFEFAYSIAPEVGPPQEYPGPAEPPPGVVSFRPPFFENVEVRRVRQFAPFETDWQGGRAEAIRWIRYRVPAHLADGRHDRLALIALADTMPAALGQYFGPGYRFYHAPSVDLSMRFFADTQDEWLLTRSISQWAGDGYASAEITLWDEHRRLLAHATQMMLVRFPDPKEFERD